MRFAAPAARRLRAAGVEVLPVAAGDAAGLRARLQDQIDDAAGLVVVGGDGMVHLGTGLVAGSDVPLGIIPAGTGNDVARALGLRLRDPAGAADDVLKGLGRDPDGRRRIDAVRTRSASGDGWFAGALCAGFDALVNERANGWHRPRGRLRYVLAAARELPAFGPRRYRLDLDGRITDVDAVLVTVANVTSYGGGMRIAPDAVVDDGLLDVVVVGPIARRRALTLFPRLYAGTHTGDPAVTLRRARHVAVEGPALVAHADGERLTRLPLTCEVVPGAISLLAG